MSGPAPSPQPIAITLFGAGGSGKSSLTLSLVRNAFTSTYDPTIEDSYSITRRVDGVEYVITITDTAGQEEYRGLWAQEALHADGFVLVYDITSRRSLEALGWFEALVRVEGECREERAETALRRRTERSEPLTRSTTRVGRSRCGTGTTVVSEASELKPVKIVAGNKVDLASSRRVPAREGLEWARRHGCGFMETSARERVNVEETFGLIVRRVVEVRREEEQRRLEEEYARATAEREVRGDNRRYTVDWTEESLRYQREQARRHETERAEQMPRRDAGRSGQSQEQREKKIRRRKSEAGVGVRHAVTAPLSPLEMEGKRMRVPIPQGDIGPPKKGWGWLRCW
ncbi:hypothetical protein VC83_02677 [Pseudogymnoascus destructans]|uniref:Ras GTPase ras2 n=2 Tax=Pseudogymnoascus destructans TaxID=655981 RepID=L8FQU7_PSED2|nr:uncharacterized protein VC83_02677 [Pseudogymnoascus destructans]ELR02919.1 hypothetical protein GMDG_01140 [Pseudogymnoascus destructans 20631-21]OAF60986.1 hypothetical protein VC83_02677 [Pseudogymnoascus destructans]